MNDKSMTEPLSRRRRRSTLPASDLYPVHTAALGNGPGQLVTEEVDLSRLALEEIDSEILCRMHDDIHKIMTQRSIDMKARHKALNPRLQP